MWKYDGHNSHNNEDDYKCTECGYSDWWPIYTDPNKPMLACRGCASIKEAKICAIEDERELRLNTIAEQDAKMWQALYKEQKFELV
jgi:hypothetical protein